MSSYWAGYHGSGLVLSQAEMDAFLKEYKKKNPSQADSLDEAVEDYPFEEINFICAPYAGTITENVQENCPSSFLGQTFCFEKISDDCCEGPMFVPFFRSDGRMNRHECREDGTYEGISMQTPDLENGALYVLFSHKDLDSVNAFFERPYASYNDFVKEFVDQLGAYLPEDFDWNAHLGNLSYACYA